MKKCLPIISVVLLTVSALAGCANRIYSVHQNNLVRRNPSSEQNNAAMQGNEPAIIQTALSANGASSPIVSPDASAAYEKLIAYKAEGYEQQSVADFNAALASTPDELTEFLAAVADVSNTISSDDENYEFFTTTITFSSHELYCEHMGEEFTLFLSMSKQSRLCDYLDDAGEPVYEFNCFVESNVAYSISNPKLVSVEERDKVLLTYKEEMQNYLSSLSETEITDGDVKKMLIDKSAELADSLSTENMKLSPCEIYLLDINGEGAIRE